MKKLFLLIPVLAFALMAKAVVTNIDNSTPDALRLALHYANDGDVIIMAGGTYEESNSNYIAFNSKNVTVKAADGETVIIKPHVPFTVSGGARAEIQGVKIDASELCSLGSYSHLMYASDAAANNRLILDGCEIYGYTVGKAVIACRSSYKLDSLIINNCKFYNHTTRSCVFLENEENKGLIVTNSTFYNIATGTESFGAGIIDDRSADAKVRVDHCTFYNVVAQNTDYAAVGKNAISDGIVSNSIFMLPENVDGERAIRGLAQANNCLTYNYIKDSNWGIHSSVTKNNCINGKDPLFADAANGDFSLAGNWVTMNISPARAAATDGSDLGDPRWYSAPVLPSVDFASPYQFVGAKAQIAGNLWYDDVNGYLYYNDKSECGVATWKINATRACVLAATLNMNAATTTGHKFKVEVLDAEGNSIAETAEPSSKNDAGNIALPDQIVLPAAGNYTVKLYNLQGWSSAKIDGVTFSYIGGAVQAMPGTTDISEAWFSSKGTRADGMITFSSYTDQWVKWNVATASTRSYNVTLNINNPTEYGHRFTVAIYENEEEEPVASFTESSWNKAYGTPLAINMGSALLQSGKNYVVKVTNAESGAQPKIISVGFVPAGGGLIDIPGNLSFDEVILSPRAWIDDSGTVDSLLFTARGSEGYNDQEWAKWRINVTTTGYYKFTANVSSSDEQYYKISVLNSDESITIGEKDGTGTSIGSGDKTFATDAIGLPVGEYVVKIANTYNHSKGRLLSMAASYEGGAVVEIPANPIPLTDAIITVGATRNGSGLGFNGSVSEYAQWNIEAAAGVYNFTLIVTGSNYSIYKLDVLDGGDNIFTYSQGQSGAGTVTINNVFIPAAGNYVLQLANVNSSADGVITSISAALDDVLILDENATDAAYISAVNGVKKKITLNRTFKGGMYNTICLPFSDWVSSLELVFGTGYELLELNNAELDGDVLNLNFTAVTGEFGHGRPYLIKPTHDVTNPTWTTSDGRTIDASTSYNIKSSTAADFIGSFIAGEVPAGEDNLFLGPNNLLYFSQTATPIKGTRAYFRVKVPNPAQAISRARIVTGGKVATEINLVNESAKFDGAAKIIENGQLIIIRDGVRYNVMGVKIN